MASKNKSSCEKKVAFFWNSSRIKDMSEKNNSWAERVRSLRKRLGESQREFALRLRVSIVSVQKWEWNKNPPPGPAQVLLEQMEQREEYLRQVSQASQALQRVVSQH